MNDDKCLVCGYNAHRRNSWRTECSHVECPYRKQATGDWAVGYHYEWVEEEDGDPKPLDEVLRK